MFGYLLFQRINLVLFEIVTKDFADERFNLDSNCNCNLGFIKKNIFHEFLLESNSLLIFVTFILKWRQ